MKNIVIVDINFNLNVLLKLFFFLPILANNNLPLKIYCENIMIAFFNFNFLFLFLKKKKKILILNFFPLFFFSFHRYFLLFFLLFPFFPSTSSTLQNIPHRALFLPLSFFIFFLPFSAISCHFVCKFLSLYPIKTHKLKDHTHNHTI